MRKRFLQGLEGARRSRPGGPFEEILLKSLFIGFFFFSPKLSIVNTDVEKEGFL